MDLAEVFQADEHGAYAVAGDPFFPEKFGIGSAEQK